MISLKKTIIPVFLTVLVLAGCMDNPAAPPAARNKTTTGAMEPLARIFFTGRDSFGVAFQAKVSNATLTEDAGEYDVVGSGNATHLGRIGVVQHLRLDTELDSIWGTFAFTGKQGHAANGGYKAVLSSGEDGPYSLDGVFWVTGGNIKAIKAEKDTGWGDLTGILDMDSNTMSYRMDGWLLHFVRGD